MNDHHSWIKNKRALSWLLVLIIGLGTGYTMLKEAVTERPFDNPPWLAVGVIFLTVFALLISQKERASENEDAEKITWQLPNWIKHWLSKTVRYQRLIAVIIAILLIVYVLYRIPAMLLPNDNFMPLLTIWILAFGFYLLALLPPPASLNWNWQQWWSTNQRYLRSLTGLILLALILRVWQLETIPFTLAGDEGSQGLEAVRVLEGQIRNPFATGWLGVPTMSFFFNSITIKLLGRTIIGLRLPWALIGTVTVFTTFLLVKRLKGVRFAFVVAFLVATYHYHVHFSRLGSNQIADPFFIVLSLLFLYRALDEHRLFDWALAGGITGLAFYFYAGARLTAVIILAVIIYEFIRQPRQFWQHNRHGLLILLGGFLLISGPIIQYAIQFPNEFNARINAVGIIQSGWLEREVAIRQESIGIILFDQFRRATLAFNYYPDRTVWYGLRQPLLDPFFGTFFLLGLGIGTLQLLSKKSNSRTAAMSAWWWGGMVLGGMLTESPPSSQRLITLAIPTCFFIGLALWELALLIRKSFYKVSEKGILILAVGLFSVVSLATYFADYTPKRIYGGPHAELATEIAPRLRELSPNHRVYFVGAPAMYWGFATLPYLVPQAEALDIPESFEKPETQDLVLMDKNAVFVVLPERIKELEIIEQTWPGGNTFTYFSPVSGHAIVTLYTVSATLP